MREWKMGRMERLTETNNYIGFMETYLNVDCKECQYKDTGECEEFKDECKAVADFKGFVKNMYSKLKEYEDLEEQGKMMKLPCAEIYKSSGDYVFYIFEDEIVECINCGVQIEADGNMVFTLAVNEKIFPYREPDSENDLSPEDWCEETITLSVCEWGKTVFLIREEAALKLKKG